MTGGFPRRFGPYLLLKALGSGSMGDVHLARRLDRSASGAVVIKRLHGNLAHDEDFVRRFRHESELAVLVNSVHVARVFEAGWIEESLYIEMEYIPGWPLSRVMTQLKQDESHASIESAIDLVAGALKGLAALHDAVDPRTHAPLGIVHRDLSPRNVMVGEDGLTHLIDLGIGKSNLQDWRTRTGQVFGSPGYMAPEQVRAEAADRRTDLYAAGIILYELLTSSRYIEAGPVAKVLRASLAPEFRAPSSIRTDVPPALDDIVRTAVALDPRHRFQSAEAFLTALRGVMPERDQPNSMTTLIGALLWSELSDQTTEVAKLLTQPPVAKEQAPAPVVFARVGTPKAGRSWSRSARMIGLMVAMLALGALIDRLLFRPAEEAPVLPRDVEVQAPRASPMAVPRPVQRTVSEPPKVVRKEKQAPKKAIAAPSPDPPPPVAKDVSAEIERLMLRAQALQRSLPHDSPEAERAGRALRALLLERGKKEVSADGELIERIDAELTELAGGLPQ